MNSWKEIPSFLACVDYCQFYNTTCNVTFQRVDRTSLWKIFLYFTFQTNIMSHIHAHTNRYVFILKFLSTFYFILSYACFSSQNKQIKIYVAQCLTSKHSNLLTNSSWPALPHFNRQSFIIFFHREEKEPLNTPCGSMKNSSVEFDGRVVHSRSGEIIGKNSSVWV